MGVNFKSSKETFDVLEDINKEILACFNVLSRLETPDVTRTRTSG